jgi:hypothetical protein
MFDRRSVDERVSRPRGEVAEWLKAPDSKSGLPERVTGVRIPSSPPFSITTTKRIRTCSAERPNQTTRGIPSFRRRSPKGAKAALRHFSIPTPIRIRTCSAEGPNQTTRGIPSFRRRSPKGVKAALRHFIYYRNILENSRTRAPARKRDRSRTDQLTRHFRL